MTDQDDFEPLARKWRPAFDVYLDSGPADVVADEAIRVATAMLRYCGGCSLLPQLSEALWQYQETIHTNTLWNRPPHEANLLLNERLEGLARVANDQRIDTIALRTAQITALQLRRGDLVPNRPFELKIYLASQIIKDLIRHCFLDTARAFAVGGRFRSSAESQAFYDNVMCHINSVIRGLGNRLATDPTGKGLRRCRIVPKTTTASMMFNEAYRLDV